MADAPIILQTEALARYFGGLRAVDGVDLAIRQGAFHSIIGPNGAGKTTLFNLLSGVLKPTSGRIFLRGQDITRLPPHRMAHLGMGRSYQITNIFPTLSVLENVRLAAQALTNHNFRLFSSATSFSADEQRAWQALKDTGLEAQAALPAISLNHGAQRKLEIAILLAQDPEILLLDEPTSGLSGEAVPDFMALVKSIHDQRGKTIVLVEHNMGVVMSLSDRISVMHQGRLLAEGTPQEIASDPQVQTAYLGEILSHTPPGQPQPPAEEA